MARHTAGTHGHVEESALALGLQPRAIGTGTEKRDYVRALGPANVAAMGNGANDVLMVQQAALATEPFVVPCIEGKTIIQFNPAAPLATNH